MIAEAMSRPVRIRPHIGFDTSVPTCVVEWRRPEIIDTIVSQRALDWRAEFGNDRPIDLEIGIGNGSFLVPFCAGAPDRNMVGVEIEGYYVKKANRRLIREGLSNGRLLIGDAKLLIWKLFADGGIENVYINYPDPWFKRRHAKRRMINAETLQLLAMKMSGILTVATDDADYRDWVLESIHASGCFTVVFPEGFVTELAGHHPTKYEKKWRALGKTCYYMKLRKTTDPKMDYDRYAASQNLQFALAKITRLAGQLTTESQREH